MQSSFLLLCLTASLDAFTIQSLIGQSQVSHSGPNISGAPRGDPSDRIRSRRRRAYYFSNQVFYSLSSFIHLILFSFSTLQCWLNRNLLMNGLGNGSYTNTIDSVGWSVPPPPSHSIDSPTECNLYLVIN